MVKLTELLGFEARYVVYPVIALIAAGIVNFVIHRYLRKWAKKTKGKIDDHVISYIDGLVGPLLLISILYYVSYWLPIVDKATMYIQKSLLVGTVILVAFYSAKLVSKILATLHASHDLWQRFSQPVRTLSNIIFVLIGIAISLKVLNVNMTDEGIRFIRVIGIGVGAYVLLKMINIAIMHVENLVEDEDTTTTSETEKRAKTLGKIINNAALVLVIGIAIMMILSEFGMNITPIITGAGIAGLAVGFGAQNLVRDVISGFFLILEDQIRVGDVATINGTGGLVEAIRLRTTVLRDIEGVVHIFPNGEITQVANKTKEFSYYVINVGVAYKESVDEVMEVLKITGDQLAQDPDFSSFILAPLEILGVDDFGDSQVTIKIRIKTIPLKQWMVGRELRRRIKNTFDSKGIEIPFPHLSVYFGEASKPFNLSLPSPPEELRKNK